MTVRISFVIGSLAIGGAETQLIRLANGLDRSRFSPSIICLSGGGELQELVAPDVPISTLGLERGPSRSTLGRPVVAARIVLRLARAFHSHRPDIVHAYLPAAYVIAGLLAWSMRVPVIVAGRRGLTSFDSYGTRRWRVLGRIVNHVIDVQICNSKAVQRWAVAHERLPMARTRVVYNGMDVPRTDDPPVLPPEWDAAALKIAMVANFIRYKGHPEVLHAFAGLLQRHASARLVLIGDGAERDALARLARELGIDESVVFAGRRRDVAMLLPAFDFTILGSSEEGFPNALMESMACGVPAVATSVGGVPELIEDFVNGRLVPYGDVAAMTDALSWMVEHPNERHEMGRMARQLIRDRFSTRRMVTETERVYTEFLPAKAAIPVAD